MPVSPNVLEVLRAVHTRARYALPESNVALLTGLADGLLALRHGGCASVHGTSLLVAQDLALTPKGLAALAEAEGEDDGVSAVQDLLGSRP